MPGTGDMARHRAPHGAKTDKSDVDDVLRCPDRLVCGLAIVPALQLW
jgi:hypothetical protein